MSIEKKLKTIAQIGGLTALGFLAGSCATETKAQVVTPPIAVPNPSQPADSEADLIIKRPGWSVYRFSDQTVRIRTGLFVSTSLREALIYLERERSCQLSSVSEINEMLDDLLVVVKDKECLPGQ